MTKQETVSAERKKEDLREFLIELLDNAVVPYEEWGNRDTPSAIAGTAKMRAYLKCGCDFKFLSDGYDGDELSTEDSYDVCNGFKHKNTTYILHIFHYEFEDEGSWNPSYAPTKFSLDFHKGKDWY